MLKYNDYNLLIVVSKTITTNITEENIRENEERIRADILNALEFLNKNNISHGDVSIDNCGYDKETQQFVLFDFGVAKIAANPKELAELKIIDRNNLERSFNYKLNRQAFQFSKSQSSKSKFF